MDDKAQRKRHQKVVAMGVRGQFVFKMHRMVLGGNHRYASLIVALLLDVIKLLINVQEYTVVDHSLTKP